jgi:hypothetical protein
MQGALLEFAYFDNRKVVADKPSLADQPEIASGIACSFVLDFHVLASFGCWPEDCWRKAPYYQMLISFDLNTLL